MLEIVFSRLACLSVSDAFLPVNHIMPFYLMRLACAFKKALASS